ncbi:MAG TPA: hypothetical protein VEQ84_14370 [Vicinamibacteria bacterium]|nr:hypothetical protein [Vicinamibacteria bacterium]
MCAQTIDPIFRSWRWTEDVTAARAFGLAGAVTGLADDGAAAAFNPAGLATIPRAGELQLGLKTANDATLPNGDRIHNLTKGTTPASLALRIGSRVGLSYHFVDLRSASRIDFDDGRERGSLKTSVNGPGIGLGVRVSPFVNIGLSVTAYRFYINEGDYTRVTGGRLDTVVRFNSNGDTRVAGAVGALVKARELSYGLAFRLGRRWRGRRTAIDPSTSRVLDEGTTFGVRSPSVLSSGIAWQPELRRAQSFLLSAQLDRVFLGKIEPSPASGLPFAASDYRMKSGFEWRAGGELTIPVLGRWASHGAGRPNRLQFRAGFLHQPAGSFVYEGADPVQQGLFPAAGARNLVSIGTSIGGVTMWRLSGAYRFGGDYRQAVVGVAIRYPGLFP